MKKKYVLPTISLISILCLAVGIFAYNHFANSNPDKTPTKVANMDKPTNEQVKDGESTKSDTIKQDQQAKAAANDTVTSRPVSMYTSAVNTSGDSVVLRFAIDGVHTGTCSIELTKGSEKIVKAAPVQALAASSTCQGYTIVKSELSSGTWSYTVTASLDSGASESRTSGEFEL